MQPNVQNYVFHYTVLIIEFGPGSWESCGRVYLTSEQATRGGLVLINVSQSNTKIWIWGCFYCCLLLCSGLDSCFCSHCAFLGLKEETRVLLIAFSMSY